MPTTFLPVATSMPPNEAVYVDRRVRDVTQSLSSFSNVRPSETEALLLYRHDENLSTRSSHGDADRVLPRVNDHALESHHGTTVSSRVMWSQKQGRVPHPLMPPPPLRSIANCRRRVANGVLDPPVKSPEAAKRASAASPIATTHAYDLLKSPITLTFERMIQACKYMLCDPSRVSCTVQIASHTLNLNLYPFVTAELIATNPSVMKKVKHRPNPNKTMTIQKRSKSDGEPSEKANKRKLKDEPLDTVVQEILDNEDLWSRIVLIMSLQQQPVGNISDYKSPAKVIPQGFWWRHYPPLEDVLFEVMAECYEVSCLQSQTVRQQAFYEALVQRMRSTAAASGLEFDATFSDKKLRDRIRCFFKTCRQNSKKRLATVLKNASKPENEDYLVKLVECVRTGKSLDAVHSRSAAAASLPKKKQKRPRSRTNKPRGSL